MQENKNCQFPTLGINFLFGDNKTAAIIIAASVHA